MGRVRDPSHRWRRSARASWERPCTPPSRSREALRSCRLLATASLCRHRGVRGMYAPVPQGWPSRSRKIECRVGHAHWHVCRSWQSARYGRRRAQTPTTSPRAACGAIVSGRSMSSRCTSAFHDRPSTVGTAPAMVHLRSRSDATADIAGSTSSDGSTRSLPRDLTTTEAGVACSDPHAAPAVAERQLTRVEPSED